MGSETYVTFSKSARFCRATDIAADSVPGHTGGLPRGDSHGPPSTASSEVANYRLRMKSTLWQRRKVLRKHLIQAFGTPTSLGETGPLLTEVVDSRVIHVHSRVVG
jgi:hypothetical protein